MSWRARSRKRWRSSVQPQPAPEGLYESPRKALEAVGDYFRGLSGKLTDASIQMCYALIGANWVVFGSVGGILSNIYAKLSLLMVMLTLGLNVIVIWTLTESIKRRSDRGEKYPDKWKTDYEAYLKKPDTFPFTTFQENLGTAARYIKAIFPLAGAILLIWGAVVTPGPIVPHH